jgi:hypothetical protein
MLITQLFRWSSAAQQRIRWCPRLPVFCRFCTRASHMPTVDKIRRSLQPRSLRPRCPELRPRGWTSTYDLDSGAPMPYPAISGVEERDQAVHEPPHLYIGGLARRRDLASSILIGNKCIPVFLGIYYRPVQPVRIRSDQLRSGPLLYTLCSILPESRGTLSYPQRTVSDRPVFFSARAFLFIYLLRSINHASAQID